MLLIPSSGQGEYSRYWNSGKPLCLGERCSLGGRVCSGTTFLSRYVVVNRGVALWSMSLVALLLVIIGLCVCVCVTSTMRNGASSMVCFLFFVYMRCGFDTPHGNSDCVQYTVNISRPSLGWYLQRIPMSNSCHGGKIESECMWNVNPCNLSWMGKVKKQRFSD